MVMTEAERLERLNAVIAGTGATVNDAYGIWALYSTLADSHIEQLAGWADLEYLVAGSSKITDASLGAICGFRRLTDLCIGGNAISGAALAKCDLPSTIQSLGLAAIELGDDAISAVVRCVNITVLNVNHCNLSEESLVRVAKLPRLQILEALGAKSTLKSSRAISLQHPAVLFRLRDGVWQAGECRRQPFPSERE